jgi:DinB superfamily
VPTIAEYRALPREARLARLGRTVGELTAALSGPGIAALGERPAPGAWAPIEILCHLRDVEESFLERFQQILAMDEPRFPRTSPDRWAEERQYRRQDAVAALAAFARRRGESLALLQGLAPPQWERAGVQLDSRGRRTLDDFLAVMAWHDDNHLDQLRRALDGRS